jgi:AcrR family transcriptional regulator
MATTPERRRRLDAAAVLSAAEQLLDEHGLDDLTMTLLAGQLGTNVSSLYNHVSNLEDLRSELQLRAIRQLADTVRSTAMGRSGDDGLRAIADAFLGFARRWPHRYDLMTRPPLDRDRYFAAAAGAIEAVGTMLHGPGRATADLASEMAMFSALHGYAALEVGGFLGPAPGLVVSTDEVYRLVVDGAIAAVRGTA